MEEKRTKRRAHISTFYRMIFLYNLSNCSVARLLSNFQEGSAFFGYRYGYVRAAVSSTPL